MAHSWLSDAWIEITVCVRHLVGYLQSNSEMLWKLLQDPKPSCCRNFKTKFNPGTYTDCLPKPPFLQNTHKSALHNSRNQGPTLSLVLTVLLTKAADSDYSYQESPYPRFLFCFVFVNQEKRVDGQQSLDSHSFPILEFLCKFCEKLSLFDFNFLIFKKYGVSFSSAFF